MSLELVTAPTEEPVTVDEVKAHLRIDNDEDDVYLGLLIAAAREHAETRIRRQLCTATWKLRLDCFPCWQIDVPLPPLVSVTTLAYTDTGGTTQTLTENTHFTKDIYREPARIIPAYGQVWPATRDTVNAVSLTFVAGYGGADSVPQAIRYGILLLVGRMFQTREGFVSASLMEDKQINTLLDSCGWGSYA